MLRINISSHRVRAEPATNRTAGTNGEGMPGLEFAPVSPTRRNGRKANSKQETVFDKVGRQPAYASVFDAAAASATIRCYFVSN